MSTRIGYVLRHVGNGRFHTGQTSAYVKEVDQAKVFEIGEGSIHAVVPVRVTEEPGPPIREVVRLLPGVTLEDGMKFAVQRNGDQYWNQVGWQSLAAANLWDTLGSTVDSVRRLQLVSTIVGIREVPGATVWKVEEITE